jgi:toxin CptA
LLPDDLQMFRYGGEEFVVLAPRHAGGRIGRLPGCHSSATGRVTLGSVAGLWQQTISAGVVACQPGDPVNHSLQQADLALYAAKHRGRNRVCLASDLADASQFFSHSS